jgi:L-threonylcarbamoyladenylate synthase
LLHPVPFNSESVSEAASAVRRGGLIVYPTDTVYGLGCDPANEEAAERLARAKRREEKPISVLCSSVDTASQLVELDGAALRLAERHWPGALTIVAPLRRSLPFPIHRGTGTLGVRVPALPLCVELIARCGGWLTGTSANVSGRPSARTASEAASQLVDKVDMILDGGRLEGLESTVVRAGREGIQVLRAGPVRVADEAKHP